MSDIKIGPNLCKKFNVKLMYLFGSQAKGNAVQQSDFDIAVLFKETPSDPLAIRESMNLSSELSKFFPNKIDVVSLHYTPLLLKYEVVAHGQILYCEEENDRINFEVAVTKEYIDEQYTRNIYYNALKERVEKGVF